MNTNKERDELTEIMREVRDLLRELVNAGKPKYETKDVRFKTIDEIDYDTKS